MKLKMSSIDHAESDGQMECSEFDGQMEQVNQILEDMLHAFISRKQFDREECLLCIIAQSIQSQS